MTIRIMESGMQVVKLVGMYFITDWWIDKKKGCDVLIEHFFMVPQRPLDIELSQ